MMKRFGFYLNKHFKEMTWIFIGWAFVCGWVNYKLDDNLFGFLLSLPILFIFAIQVKYYKSYSNKNPSSPMPFVSEDGKNNLLSKIMLGIGLWFSGGLTLAFLIDAIWYRETFNDFSNKLWAQSWVGVCFFVILFALFLLRKNSFIKKINLKLDGYLPTCVTILFMISFIIVSKLFAN